MFDDNQENNISSTATVELQSTELWGALDKVDVSWLVDAESGWKKADDNEMR